MEPYANAQVVRMNYLALIIGIVSALFIIYRFRKTRLEKKAWAYPLFVASFPLYYLAFALYAQDYKVLSYEFIFAVFYMGFAFLAYKLKYAYALLLLAVLSLVHGVYDYFHEDIFINEGTPSWWVEFCGSIDIILGLYLLVLYALHKKGKRTLTT